MIQFKPYPLNDVQDWLSILKSVSLPLTESLSDLWQGKVFVVQDSERIVGFCAYDFLSDETAVVRMIYIVPEERGNKFGDALMRAVLNSIDIHGRDRVIFLGNSNELKFYAHEGMDVIDAVFLLSDDLSGRLPINLETLEGLCLPSVNAFFSKPCKGHVR